MNLLEDFSKEFRKRHDFYSEDLELLFSKWEKTIFIDIPEAWILPIDEMLLAFSKINIFPICVQQKFGLLFLRYEELKLKEELNIKYSEITQDKEYLKIQAEAYYKIKSIDEDLYLFMDIDLNDIEIEYNKKYCTNIYYN